MKTRIIPNALYFQQVKEALVLDKQVRITIKGNSMLPFLREGDQVELRKITLSDLALGNVVLAMYMNNYILHRIIKCKKQSVVLAGDGNYHQLEIVDHTAVMAVVTAAYRNGQVVNITSNGQRLLGFLWYQGRFLRLVYNKIIGVKGKL